MVLEAVSWIGDILFVGSLMVSVASSATEGELEMEENLAEKEREVDPAEEVEVERMWEEDKEEEVEVVRVRVWRL